MAIFLFSLTGLPPFAGFFGKFYVFYALVARGGTFMVTLAVARHLELGALALLLRARAQGDVLRGAARRGAARRVAPAHATLLGVLAVPTVALFLVWSPLQRLVDGALGEWAPASTPSSAQVERSVKRSRVQLASRSATK